MEGGSPSIEAQGCIRGRKEKRSDKEATELITKVRERSDGSKPSFISDNLDSYPHALLNVYGEEDLSEEVHGVVVEVLRP